MSLMPSLSRQEMNGQQTEADVNTLSQHSGLLYVLLQLIGRMSLQCAASVFLALQLKKPHVCVCVCVYVCVSE